MRRQALLNDTENVLGSGNQLLKLAYIRIHIFVIEILDHLCRHQPVQGWQVYNLSRYWIERSRDAHLQHVVVPVAVGVIAFAVERVILAGGKSVRMEPVRGREFVPASDVRHPMSPA